jgi:hypothetical protein
MVGYFAGTQHSSQCMDLPYICHVHVTECALDEIEDADSLGGYREEAFMSSRSAISLVNRATQGTY